MNPEMMDCILIFLMDATKRKRGKTSEKKTRKKEKPKKKKKKWRLLKGRFLKGSNIYRGGIYRAVKNFMTTVEMQKKRAFGVGFFLLSSE